MQLYMYIHKDTTRDPTTHTPPHLVPHGPSLYICSNAIVLSISGHLITRLVCRGMDPSPCLSKGYESQVLPLLISLLSLSIKAKIGARGGTTGRRNVQLAIQKDLLLVTPLDKPTDTSSLWVAQRALSQHMTVTSTVPHHHHHLLVELIRHNQRESEVEASGAK